MDYWSNGQDPEVEDTDAALSLLTANVQSLPAEDGEEVVETHGDQPLSLGQTSSRLGPVQRTQPVAPAYLAPVGQHDFNRRNHALRRLRRRYELSMRYQQRPEYWHYRNRPRKDTDEFGNIIWTKEMEEAFSNGILCKQICPALHTNGAIALINIPPMGRKKRSQHGKSFGRNELIVEWMLQETGQLRKRKQISSHIQVLDGVFKGCSDCMSPPRCLLSLKGNNRCAGQQLNKKPDDSKAPEPELYDYYNDSIADMVRNWPALRTLLTNSSVSDSNTAMMPPILKSNDSFMDSHPLNYLDFEMWIGPSVNVDKCLHRYTKTASHDAAFTRAERTLDDINNWQYRYPDLAPIIAEFATLGSCDVVLVDACLEMMTDFPLEQVKLGINFQLGFDGAECSGLHGPSCLKSFSCLTRVYQQGKCTRQREVDSCQVIGDGKVKPPFESRWWAQEFVRLTDSHLMAEDTGKEANVTAAIESAKQFFRDLTIMQLIYTGSRRFQDHPGIGSTQAQQRAAVLLWSFSQAEPGQAALTIPCKLGLPPTEPLQVGALPDASFEKPTFGVDTVANATTGGILESSYHTLPDHDVNLTQQYSSDMEELCQDGFMMLAQQTNSNPSSRAIAVPIAIEGDISNPRDIHGFLTSQPLYTQYPIFGVSQHDGVENMHGRGAYLEEAYSRNDVDASHGIEMMQFATGDLDAFQIGRRQKALDHFDASTHEMLQMQLGDAKPVSGFDDSRNYSCRPYEQGSTGVMSRPNPEVTDTFVKSMPSHGKNETAADMLWDEFDLTAGLSDPASLITRPPLQHCHSFAGVLHTDDSDPDTPRRSFKRLLEQVGLDQSSVSFGQPNDTTSIEFGELGRSHSQPVPDIRSEHNDGHLQNIGNVADWQNMKFESSTTAD